MKNIKKRLIVILPLALMTVSAGSATALCSGTPFNPTTDVCWNCVFPVKIGNVVTEANTSGSPDPPNRTSSSVCTCPAPPPIFKRTGVTTSLWEPSALVEIVRDPFCSPTLGAQLPLGANRRAGFFGGSTGSQPGISGGDHTFAQAHYINFPLWKAMAVITDISCGTASQDVSVGYMSELDPAWYSDALAVLLAPESALFANKLAQLACVADSAAANVWLPIPALYWCMGSWGSVFPLDGNIADSVPVQASAGLAARVHFMFARPDIAARSKLPGAKQVMDCSSAATWPCACLPSVPAWNKWSYRLHLAKPVRDAFCTPIGRSSLLWGAGKNPPYMEGNFLWMTFRKHECCAF